MRMYLIDANSGEALADYANRPAVPSQGDFIIVDKDRWVVEEVTWYDYITRVDIKVRKRPG